MLKMILCTDNNNGLGLNNSLPWNNKKEMEHFKNTTMNSVVVMGKNTFLSINKILPNRENIIFSRDKNFKVENAIVTDDIDFVIELSKTKNVWIIGGKKIYELFIDYVEEVVLSKLHNSYNCDLFFDDKILKFFKVFKTEQYDEFTVYHYKNFKHKILNGNLCSSTIIDNLIKVNDLLISQYKKPLRLDIILIGNDFASSVYVKRKVELSKKIGINVHVHKYENISESQIISLIEKLNIDDDVNGILIQSPLPEDLNLDKLSKIINPLKDVDCFNPTNFGNFFKENNNTIVPIPCTPLGVLKILKYYNIDIKSKNVVILGRSNIVGKPLIPLLINENATVTICHSKTNNLKEITKNADILISAMGQSELIKKDYIKENAILIDVGITRNQNNKLTGDIDFYDCIEKCSYITPVPGGIGPMTLAMLYFNLLELYKKQKESK